MVVLYLNSPERGPARFELWREEEEGMTKIVRAQKGMTVFWEASYTNNQYSKGRNN